MKEQLAAANACILNGALEKAQETLLEVKATSQVDQRIKSHLMAIIEFHRGQFADCLRLLRLTAERYGDNVNLLRDCAVCQYHLQDMEGFRASLSRLEHLLVELESQLSANSLVECELMLGKFSEEDARLGPAIQFYEQALERAQKPAHRLRALIQKTRWQALFARLPELSTHYRELISVVQDRISKDLRIELEHSLMLIELRLIGGDHAWQRVSRLLPEIDDLDQRLLVFDYIEGALAQEIEIPNFAIEKASQFSNLDPFETFLSKVVKGRLDHHELLHDLTMLAPRLPWASYLRLLCISANLEQNGSIRQELHRKIQLIIRALDSRSQALWTDRLKQALQTQEVRIEFSARSRSLQIQGKTLDLSKKKIGLQLLERLVSKSAIPVDEAISLLWQSEFSPEHYHRLRMSVHRLNTLIFEATGHGKVVEVDSQNVRLKPQVRLRHAPSDEAFDLGLLGV